MARQIRHEVLAAYENACDCFYYGEGKDKWNSCGLDDETASRVWVSACIMMSKNESDNIYAMDVQTYGLLAQL